MALCLAYFCVGLVRDALATMWYQAVSRSKAGEAGGIGSGLTAYDVIILGFLIRSWSPELIASYALGTGLGTYLIVKLRKEG